ncbi:cysteine--tRNA ligase [Candidatus Falkowbacteria bacterium]|nr:cysteine--tRNA ligase [Candidatus Falkowbacteria bacterium]
MKFFDTWTRKKEEFKPLDKMAVKIYSCGPTVYNFAHIGNLRTYLFADILKRSLMYCGYKVKHVMNVTDVGHLTDDGDTGEDKMEKAARMENKSAKDIANFYWQAFRDDLAKLNISEPTIWCRASEYIQEQIDLIKKLEEKGYTYKISDGIYFDTSKIKDYGYLARLDIKGLNEGARIATNKEKRNSTDFALWKFSPTIRKRQQEWESPWAPPGRGKAFGFPGWHTECVAMALKCLGAPIDIHTGAIDLAPVHHTNEIAQARALLNKKFVQIWMHGEFVIINDKKMAKSEGNFMTLASLIGQGYDPMSYRYLCLTTHYRSKLNFNFEALLAAQAGLNNLREKFLNFGKASGNIISEFQKQFADAIDDDLNMPQAMALVWAVLKAEASDADKRATLLDFDKVLGLNLENYQEQSVEIPDDIKKIADERERVRQKKNWKRSDQLRDELEKLGWIVRDTSVGYELKKKI